MTNTTLTLIAAELKTQQKLNLAKLNKVVLFHANDAIKDFLNNNKNRPTRQSRTVTRALNEQCPQQAYYIIRSAEVNF